MIWDGAGFGVKGEWHPEPRWRIIFWLTVHIELGRPHMEGGRLVLPIDFGILAAAIGKLDDSGNKVTPSRLRVIVGRISRATAACCFARSSSSLIFRMTRQTIGAVTLTEEAQHGKSPDSGAEDGNNLKSKCY
jgi:hypothetical protein